jgi:kumamolisin
MPESHVRLAGSKRGEEPNARHVGDVDSASPIELTVTVHPEDFAHASEEVERVLGRFGLSVEPTYPATGSLAVSGSAGQIEDAFRAGLGLYDHGPDGILRGRKGEIHIPADLDGVVTGVFGLDQRRVARRLTGSGDSPPGPSPLRPEELEQRYSFPEGYGKGQTIAIAEFGGGYFPDDIRIFCKTHGRTVPEIEVVSVGAVPLTPAEITAAVAQQQAPLVGESHEVTMDVEIVAGLCPDAKIRIFFATFDQKGWIDLLDRVVAEDPPPVSLSVSWGDAEDSAKWSPAAVDAINQRLRAAARRGITVCAAAGDDGCGDQMQDERAHVHFPASSPYVLAVGGTMLAGDAEVVWWNCPGDRSQPQTYPRGGSTGGGVSAVFARPVWQGVHVRSLNPGDFDGRVVPDVAGLAGLPGYATVFQGQPRMNGGTSGTTPLWAALVARIAAVAPEKPLGFFTELLYQAGADGRLRGASGFKDITQGSNVTPKPGFGYEASEGFDAVTGWGVPNGHALLASLRK